jgi:hypothetical protein
MSASARTSTALHAEGMEDVTRLPKITENPAARPPNRRLATSGENVLRSEGGRGVAKQIQAETPAVRRLLPV